MDILKLLLATLMLCASGVSAQNPTQIYHAEYYNGHKAVPMYLPLFTEHPGIHDLNIAIAVHFDCILQKDMQTFWTRIFSDKLPLTSRVLLLMLCDLQATLNGETGVWLPVEVLFMNLQAYLMLPISTH